MRRPGRSVETLCPQLFLFPRGHFAWFSGVLSRSQPSSHFIVGSLLKMFQRGYGTWWHYCVSPMMPANTNL